MYIHFVKAISCVKGFDKFKSMKTVVLHGLARESCQKRGKSPRQTASAFPKAYSAFWNYRRFFSEAMTSNTMSRSFSPSLSSSAHICLVSAECAALWSARGLLVTRYSTDTPSARAILTAFSTVREAQ